MPILVQIASTPSELDALFRMRHRVYVEQGGYMPATADGRIYDRFDAFPSTTNFLAYDGDRLVGGVRVMRDGGAGTHGDDYFDFGPYLPEGAVVGSGSMLWVDAECRGRQHIVPLLMNLSFYQVAARGVTHMVGTVNPEVERRFFSCGYEPVGPVFTYPKTGVPFRPVVLEIAKIAAPIRAFIERQGTAALLEGYNRLLLTPGERLFAAGEPSDAVYVVVEGSVRAVTDGQQFPLGPGELVGELGVLLDRPRSADVVADDRALLVRVPRDEFLDALQTRGELSRAVLRSTATRLYDAARVA